MILAHPMESSVPLILRQVIMAIILVLPVSVGSRATAATITPISVTASSEFSASQGAANLINGSGLSGSGPIQSQTHNNAGSATSMWHSNGSVVADSWLVFDLGAEFSLSGIDIWQMNQAGQLGRGIKTFAIYTSSNALGPITDFAGNFTLNQGGGTASEAAKNLPLSLSGVRRVKFVIANCWSGLASDYVGLSEVRFQGTGPALLVTSFKQSRFLVQSNEALLNSTTFNLAASGDITNGLFRIGDSPAVPVNLTSAQTVTAMAPDVSVSSVVLATVTVDGQVVASQSIVIQPVRHLTIYVLPHSHVDIGYTDLQNITIDKQVNNLVQGIQYAQQTAAYPPGARFIWNLEGTFPAELYLERFDAQARANFLAAVENGQVEVNGMYINALTGLCRPEELLRLFRHGTQLADLTGVPVESAMLSDVPDLTWGSVTAMAQAGIKYLSTGPNYFDRIGYVLQDWQNKPFYWLGPDGHSKVLVWMCFQGYGMAHIYGALGETVINDVMVSLEQAENPYDVAYIRWAGHGDNAVPEPEICDAVRDWNAQYAYPKLIISGTTEAFRALEQRHGDSLPVVTGDWTPPLGGWQWLVRTRNRNEPEELGPARTGRGSVCHGQPRRIFRHGLRCRVVQRFAIFRTHLGRMEQRQRAGQPVRVGSMGVQAELRD
ncbi:hypothetical protein OKA05_11305 [Luteolibacter arcticus]|uniref:F5/8 type C domain-containing protein n=1 Tax=Luteolibacter arcticus TaxID=1581411 RepID=A0ABT3GI10_9BACT|nr:hypothetical protein [Luteolibacter arcticus]MCW1923141.1 hypothetical protein [Luteolibacter arcticus]